MSILNKSFKKAVSGQGFLIDPSPLENGVNLFTDDTARDAYFNANADELASMTKTRFA